MRTKIIRHTVLVVGRKTSVSIEGAFWESLKEIAAGCGTTLNALITSIALDRGQYNLSSAIRVFVLNHYWPQSQWLGQRDPVPASGAMIATPSLQPALRHS
ncbi:MAG: ribbon-helix-helix domain-containing protein [Bradyrhizobium sp.]